MGGNGSSPFDDGVAFPSHAPIRVVMTAAHAGHASERVPVGGAAAICERLCAAWGAHSDLEVTVLGAGPEPPPGGVAYHRIPLLDRPPSALGELAYARFCRAFERAATDWILACPYRPVVLSHDLSEGPDFAALDRAGIPVSALVHVDVVEYFTRIYLREAVPAPLAARAFAWLGRVGAVPDLLRLVFDKQAAAAAHCRRLVVPSAGMARVLHDTYPNLPSERVAVLGWGGVPSPHSAAEVAAEKARLRALWDLPDGAPVLMTLSRIAPEKGQDLLLRACMVAEMLGEAPRHLRVVIVGAPAYMQGDRFYRKLRRHGAALRTPVIFAGHLGGARKRAALELATVFVAPSRHESYGLTTMEAMDAGRPVVATRTHGAEATVDASCGVLIGPGPDPEMRLWLAVRDLLENPARHARLAEGARRRAASESFARAAETLREVLAISAAGSRTSTAP